MKTLTAPRKSRPQASDPVEIKVQQAIARLLAIGLDYADLAKILGHVSTNTVRRWAARKHLSQYAQFSRLQEFSEILDLAEQAFGKEALAWFQDPIASLGNVLPATLLRDPANGPNLVKRALQNALSGGVA